MEWADKLKEEYGKIAKENSLSNLQNSDSQKSDSLGRTDDTVAQEVGLGSRDTYRKAEYIYQNADEEMIKQLDEGNLSINKAYVTLKERANQLEQANQVLEDTYNELSGKYQQLNNTADFLKQKENNMREIVGKAYTDLGRELKDAQLHLKRQGSSEGIFQKWYQSLGFNHQQVSRLLQRYELLTNCEEPQKQLIEELPVSLTYEISKPSADQELKIYSARQHSNS